MNLITFSFKNATVKWWRSLTLGFLILAATMVMVIAGSFISAIKHKVENVILQGITGHIQIRADKSQEGDMVEQYNKGWDAIQPLRPSTIEPIQKMLRQKFPQLESSLLIRRSGFLTNAEKKEETTFIGIEPRAKQYQDAFLLKEGRYPNPAGSVEILLTEEQAAALHAKIGDSITITTKNQYGLNSTLDLKVVGIGNFIMLSLFSYKACYLSNDSMRRLLSLDPGSATDVILFTSDPGQTTTLIRDISKELTAAKIENTITAGAKLKSSDLEVTEFGNFKENPNAKEKVKISGFAEMGLSFKSIGDTLFIMLNILVLFLMVIISFLIVNLVYLMGLERYREIGTLRALGFSRNQVTRIFMGEILSISLLFGLLGSLLSAGLVYFLGRAGIPSPIPALDFFMGKSLSLELDPVQIPITLGVITTFSLAAALYPAYQACSVDPAQTLRSI